MANFTTWSGGLAQNTRQFRGSVKPGSISRRSSLSRNGSITNSLKSGDKNLAACCEFLFSRWTEYNDCISAYKGRIRQSAWVLLLLPHSGRCVEDIPIAGWSSLHNQQKRAARRTSMAYNITLLLGSVPLTGSFLQAKIKASYGFSPGPTTTPDRSSSLFLASVDSNAEPIVSSGHPRNRGRQTQRTASSTRGCRANSAWARWRAFGGSPVLVSGLGGFQGLIFVRCSSLIWKGRTSSDQVLQTNRPRCPVNDIHLRPLTPVVYEAKYELERTPKHRRQSLPSPMPQGGGQANLPRRLVSSEA